MNTLVLDSHSGCVEDIQFIPSPNFDTRPDQGQIDVLVIHSISLPPQCYGNNYVEDLFSNCLDPTAHDYFADIAERKVSAHFYIKRVGEIIQFVPTHNRAWHAGDSTFKGREKVNNFSIGIELEGCDQHEFEDTQYQSLTLLSQCILQSYPLITAENIVGHSDISPGRKTDPGPCFDWSRYLNSISKT